EVPSKSLFETYQAEVVLALAVVVCLVLLFAMMVMYKAMTVILKASKAKDGVVEEEKEFIKAREGEESLGFWGRFWNRFHEAVPIEKEESIATDHEYDGIRELDNQLPSWWIYGFYASIIFGVIYLFNYHLGSGPTQAEEYEIAMEKADKEVKIYLASLDNLVDEKSVEVSIESKDLVAGKAIYDSNCAVCHANDGGGGVGPNFTDQYWIHGGDIKSIFKTIKYGVPSKGMISWEAQLSPQKMSQVANYIYSMEGQTTASPKEPQGELFEREATQEETDDTTNPSDIDDEADLEDGECC
ncbi:MAG: cbb3-type cytochrome c oxidase N-terminal domain-containing protein, partial [Ekhidna sp.]